MSFPELLTTRQAAELLGVSAATLATWRSTKAVNIPFTKIGNSIRYIREDLISMIRENRVHTDD
ncbi:Uncharacterised protein [BD1-7 clade bacterium]|uniref:Helix-turn-helix domain-containing protein n=1 Tax=BD1-7 clade bacterium TaxID=2029982 RepID=A0A5S9MTZ1_9GAMM|nr:Uncharacterised protein [BD1-7 clade bacterium]CAA0084632.1 Uncharacterised protein [BD1-7 clade bacterium]